jgi:hypothetical protein
MVTSFSTERDSFKKAAPQGYLMLLVLIFGAIFFLVLASISGYALTQNRSEAVKQTKEKAFAVAEAGLEYYRWHLAHFPSDLQNGTGHSGPYTISIPDPEGGASGSVQLGISANSSCGVTTSIDLTSKGTSADDASVPVTLTARYALPSVGSYSYIVNDSVWAGPDRVINGPYHSNGGIRMDGTANAPVTSSVATWYCDSSYGCDGANGDPSPGTKAGVFGAGPNQSLWSTSTPQVDFSAISANFTSLKTKANASGLYFPRLSSGNSNSAAYWKGYHLIFNSNGTVTVKKVTATTQLSVTPINSTDPATDRILINNEVNDATYTIPSTCGLIFVEDNVWIEGVVPSKVTVVAANVTNSGVAPSAVLENNITYGATDGSDGLTVIAQNDVLIAPDAPNTMTVNGVFVAQGGAFGRNFYGCSSSYEPRGTLTIFGSTVSNKRTGTKWVNACGSSDAGYQTRIDAFDRKLSTDPPPFTPTISTVYQFVDWRQK